MNVLAIDTSTEILGICLRTDDKRIFSLSFKMGFQHAGSLVPWIKRLCEQADRKESDLDLVVYSMGPGSFTGLRIGLSTAKGIACGADCPVIGISSLDTIVYGLIHFQGVVVPIIDARKKRFYAGFYRKGERITDYMDISMEDLIARCMDFNAVLLSGPGAGIVFDAVPEQEKRERYKIDPGYSMINPFFLLLAGMEKFNHVKRGDPDSAGPLYLRKSEAELHRKK